MANALRKYVEWIELVAWVENYWIPLYTKQHNLGETKC